MSVRNTVRTLLMSALCILCFSILLTATVADAHIVARVGGPQKKDASSVSEMTGKKGFIFPAPPAQKSNNKDINTNNNNHNTPPLIRIVDGASITADDAFPHAIISTPYGPLDFKLRPDAAPLTVQNFIKLVNQGFYNDGSKNNNGNGTTFYRYEAGFVLQGGNMNQASNSTVPLEYKIPNTQWTVGLARDSDPNSGSSEFFINLVDNSAHLCPPTNAYTVFAEVVNGFDAITAMSKLPVDEQDGIHFFVAPMPPIMSAKIEQ